MRDREEELLRVSLHVGRLQGEVDRLEGYRIGSGAYMAALERVVAARSRLEQLRREVEAEELLR